MKHTRRLSFSAIWLFSVVVGILGWLLHFGITPRPWFIYDDSYITLSNALAFTGSTSYFTSPALTGATSVAHVFLVALMTTVTAIPELALALSNLVGAVLYVAGWIYLAQTLGLSRLNSSLAAILASTTALTSLHLYNGLETGLALAGIVWSLVFLVQNRGDQLSVLCGTLPWIRPELAVWAGIALIMLLRFNYRRDAFPGYVLRNLLLLLAGTAPFLAACWISTGLPIPQTMSAKKFFFSEDCAPLKWKHDIVRAAFFYWAKGLWFVSIGFVLMVMTSLGRAILLFVCAFLIAYWVNFPGALGHYDHRYLHLLAPFVVFAVLHSAARFSAGNQRVILLLLIFLALPGLTVNLPASHLRAMEGQEFTEERLQPVANWINNHTSDSSKILVHDAGYVGFSAHRQLVDFVGLKTPRAIEYHRSITHASCGGERVTAIAQIIRSEQPDYIVILKRWDYAFHIVQGLRAQGFSLRRVFADQFGYDIYQFAPTTFR